MLDQLDCDVRHDGTYLRLTRAQIRDDSLYMDIAYRCADESHDYRRRVGAVLVLDGTILSYGWNGTPPGADNECTVFRLQNEGGQLRLAGESKPSVIHAEMNLLAKISRSTLSAKGATVYCTDQPCIRCAIALSQAHIREFVFSKPYRDAEGLEHLRSQGIIVRDIAGRLYNL